MKRGYIYLSLGVIAYAGLIGWSGTLKDGIIPLAAQSRGIRHPRIPREAFPNAEGDEVTFADLDPAYFQRECVSCHVSYGRDLAPPELQTRDNEPAPVYYAGGQAGTVFNATSKAFEQPSPAIVDAGLEKEFLAGEVFFEGNFVSNPDAPFGGLGPTYVKSSCISCHPGYGRAKRTDDFSQEYGNGYIAFVHNPDGTIVEGYTFMLQIHSVAPYTPYARDVEITWNEFTDQYGNRYPDGSPYNAGKPTEGSLTYPTADIVDPQIPLPDDYKVSLEATIGIYGTGLLDAISDESILAEYDRQQSMPGPVKGQHGKWIAEPYSGEKRLGKFTWHCTRATLQNGPGYNGLYNTTNVTREDRPHLYATEQWMDRQRELGIDVSDLEGQQPAELSQEDLSDFMIWHRGLAVPAARNLDRPQVIRGRELFGELGCVSCHKPEWRTGKYEPMPAYSHQIIRPYTDLLMHDMGDENKGRYRTYRTPPLWGRGLMKKAANHTDMFHDLRARDFEEAILWHFGEAEFAREQFRNLPAEDRQSLIQFVQSL
ncbi:di-heme oxidoredictase family protein [Puniceicoccus vermicola]|uniref:C-type cytochrome n=1 Tax=Puniceicoccus vermicola TaxID=388746 RepID=A0A7X1B1K3_9BACT|nr:di-heme oxidoredictase family protein [Puniceicoccus vermicola]MBC2603929.1 c-type cytochrome [Puniceicoccus vermicola]